MAGEPAVLAATSDVEGWGYVNTVLTQLAGGEGRGARAAGRRLATPGESCDADVRPGPDGLGRA